VHIESDGTYHVSVNKHQWLTSGSTFFRRDGSLYSTADGSLKQIGRPRAISGVDTLGEWNGHTWSYSAGGANVSVSVRVYDAINGKLAIFTQVYFDVNTVVTPCPGNKAATILLSITLPNVTDFQNSFTCRLSGELVVK